jgi:hypothetical protein
MALRRKKTTRSSSRKPQWLVTLGTLVTAINALVRVVGLFRKKGTTTTRSNDRAEPRPPVSSAPPRKSAPRESAPASRRGPGRGVVQKEPAPVGTDGGIPALFKNKISDRIVQASGTIVKILPDDLDTSDGSEMHQKFLVELSDRDRTTIKVCHNLKFGRAPVREGEVISFRGEYEFTDFGGTVHWTHHDPRGIHDDGWIEYDGQRYG